MPTAFDVRALTSTIRIELDDSLSPEEQERIRSSWVDVIAEDGAEPSLTLRAGLSPQPNAAPGVRSVTDSSPAALADRISSDVTVAAITGLKGDALMLHAAAIALDDGRVIGLVGPSGRGKTTAARTLARDFGYVTDETLAIGPDGVVVPYPKPLSIGDRPGAKRTRSASAFGLRALPEGELRLAALVLLDRRPGISRPSVESLTLTEALPELVPQTSYLAELDRPLRTLAGVVESTGGVRRVVYSEADSLSGVIDDILAAVHPEAAVLTDVASAYRRDCDCFTDLLTDLPLVTDTPLDQVRPGTYRRNNHADSLLVDDTLLVLQRHDVLVLDGVGPVVWLAADDSTEEELRHAALRALPTPPDGVDAAAVVGAALEQLVDARLLTRHG